MWNRPRFPVRRVSHPTNEVHACLAHIPRRLAIVHLSCPRNSPPSGTKTSDSDSSEEIFLGETSSFQARRAGTKFNLPNNLFAGIIRYSQPASNMRVMPEDFRHLAFEFNEIVGVIQDAVCDCAVMRQERRRDQCANQTEKFGNYIRKLPTPSLGGPPDPSDIYGPHQLFCRIFQIPQCDWSPLP